MKRKLQLIFAVLLLAFVSFNAEAQRPKKKKPRALKEDAVAVVAAKPEELIQRKWQFDPEFFKAKLKEEADKIRASQPEKAAEMDGQADMIAAMVSGITMDFKAEGVLEMSAMGENKTGTWKLAEGGKVLLMNSSGQKEEKLNIKELSDKKLVLENPEDTQMPIIQLVPAKQ
ncbi:MAG: hypothetical protein SFU27_10735 [Thermonemataceae bacterium]|nr:hypothetical protein [Thermonemataceae bacterium]